MEGRGEERGESTLPPKKNPVAVHMRHWPWYMPGAVGLCICTLTSDTSCGSSERTITMFTWPNWSPPTYFRHTPGGQDSAPETHGKGEINFRTPIYQKSIIPACN